MSRFFAWTACLLGVIALIAAGALLVLERGWAPKERLSPEEAFLHGDIGLEIAPLKYLLVMDDPRLGGGAFYGGKAGAPPGSWVRKFGFIPRADTRPDAPACLESGLATLPAGFALSRKLPGSGSPFPVTFGGLACAACHTREIEYGGKRHIVAGAGNARLDIIAFGEAFKNAVQNPALTAEGILSVYDERCGRAGGILAWAGRLLELNFLRFWLSSVRAELTASASKYGTAPPPDQVQTSEALPAGPSRTRAFRSVLRESMDLSGEGNFAFSKIPSTFYQSSKSCGQFDGSICDHVTRSLIAAYSSGGSVAELAQPDVAHNIVEAAKYTLDLLPEEQNAGFAALFPDRAPGRDDASRQAAERGGAVYRQYCASCHGAPSPDGWAFEGEQPYRPITPLAALGTDPWRLEFRYAASLPDAIWLAFPLPPGPSRDRQLDRLRTRIADAAAAGYGEDAALWQKLAARFEGAARRHPLGHPLAFADMTLLYDNDPAQRGYQNNALPGVFLTAPYLHNGSVPNMAQLINLEPRPARFCRGGEPYDPDALGYRSPPPGPDGCPPDAPWLFDASRPGNSNAGHDFPWRFEEAQRPENRAALQDLLEYLKNF